MPRRRAAGRGGPAAGVRRSLLARLGPHSTGKSCLYLKRLADVDEQALRELVTAGFHQLNGRTLTT